MPLYEYKCKQCNITFQVLKSVNKRDEPEKCPNCGSNQTYRLVSSFITNTVSCDSFNYAGS
ncbi:MAG: zinc ribbon domain-containing protein [Thermodesulfovibrio sp.]|jgi:putative FmdB family regulatory protein|uniref:FmdB family zinc ribbon protein n=1 Tax=unclassified Thermodesulfovibrio TaxID=2645936 RepID=UPI00083A0D1C|nr:MULTISPECIES: zinc ribbon domain-containing protein [unclassified Thermodesulfovibrio]MDI1472314.1 zinc ribbon domain-containing protein [Thermodesulfovibrio sp. 1176]MDI6714179.1 zinc ribbon domain-containing protein [Thermodesulfovibrio sp.]